MIADERLRCADCGQRVLVLVNGRCRECRTGGSYLIPESQRELDGLDPGTTIKDDERLDEAWRARNERG